MIALLLAAAVAFPGNVRRVTLDNGLTVLLAVDDSRPLVSVATMYRVGARHEAAGTTGLAHFAEHMNFRSTRRFPGGESTEAVTRLGGRWNGYTWIEQTYYAETVPREALGLALDIEAERMSAALYDAGEFAKERPSVMAELRSYDDPASVLYDAVLAASFEIHPYRHNTIGWPADVEGVTRDEAFAFYRRHYVPRNAVLVAVGDLEAAHTLSEIRARFAALPAGEPPQERAVEPEQTGERRVTVRRPGAPARLLLAWRAPALGHADFAPMVLFDALLAGGKGFQFTRTYPAPASSFLAEALAKAEVRARPETDWQASREPYVYTLAADLGEGAGFAGAEAALLGAVEAATARGWTDEELQAARRQVLTGWASDLDDLAGRAHQLAFFEALGGYELLVEIPGRLAAVTLGDLRRFAGRWLSRHRLTVGWFVPTPAASPAPTVAAAAIPPAPAAASAPRTTAVSRPEGGAPAAFRLGNGLHVALAPTAGAGLVALRGRIDAGSIYDGRWSGLSALATELLASASTEPGAPGLAWTLHEDPIASTSLRWIEFTGSCLADEAPALLRGVGARLRRAAEAARNGLTDHEWKELEAAARSRAAALAGDAEADLWRTALAALHPEGGAPAAPPWGQERGREGPTREVLRAFLAAHVSAGRTRVWLAGSVETLTRASLEQLLGQGAASGAGHAPPAASAARGPATWTERRLAWPEKSQNEIAVVWAGERSRPWDRPATELLLYLLGETGYAGRLGRALVEPGLAYSVYASLEEPPGVPGFLLIRTAADTADTAEALRRIRAVLEATARGELGEAELREAKAYLRGKRARDGDGSVAAARAAAELASRPEPTTFESITLEQLRDTARRLGARGGPLALVAGP